MYADFDFYANNYHGKKITDSETFERMAIEADALLDYITMGRIDKDAPYIEKVKLAACAICDIQYEQDSKKTAPQKTSESVGNHSVSYAVSKKTDAEYRALKISKIRLYLSNTGLLYRGLSECFPTV